MGKERRRRDMDVLLIEVLYLVAQVGDGHDISAAGVCEREFMRSAASVRPLPASR